MKIFKKTAIFMGIFAAFCAANLQAAISLGKDVSALPDEAEAFLKDNFAAAVKEVKYEKRLLRGKAYFACLENGVEIKFDKNGKWKEISSAAKDLPSSLLPKALAEVLDKKEPGAKIAKIERKGYGYRLELADNVEILLYDDLRLIKSKKN
ncbi:MAG: PepSY-like domain-containing protein [Opitutales bacterium]|nr:PepSY-like domain-containing protein [Opitutales bacterium]